MRVLSSIELPPLVEAFLPEALGADLPHPGVGFETIAPDEDGSDLWHSLLHQYNELVVENQSYVLHAFSSSCDTSMAALMTDYSGDKKKAVQQEAMPQDGHFNGEFSGMMGKGGRIKFPQEWRDHMGRSDSYMIFDEKSGQILVMREDDIDEGVIAKNLKRLGAAYRERGMNFPRMAHYTPYPYYRHVAAGEEKGARIDPQVFNWTAIEADEVFDAPFEVSLKGHGSYFSIGRSDGGWKVPSEEINKIRHAMVRIARMAVEVRDPLSNRVQNRTDLESGDVSAARPQELAEPS